MEWNLAPGDQIKRTTLHKDYGGRPRGGIGPSAKTPNVLVFSEPARGEQHGYYDGWLPDGCFHYTGEGQRGDQRMVNGNRAVRDHQAEGRALRLFEGAGGVVEYRGEFRIDDAQPWYETDAPETGGGPIRKVIVFRLRPIDTAAPDATTSKIANVMGADTVAKVPVEAQNTEKFFVDPARELIEAERVEAKLVHELRAHLAAKGHDVHRLKIVPPGEAKPLFTDLHDATTELIIEAKGSCTRENVRMAIGQLADYSRFRPEAGKAILLPSQPRPDLAKLISAQGIALIWATEAGFAASEDDLL